MKVCQTGENWKLDGEISFDNSEHEELNKFSELLGEIYDGTEGAIAGLRKGWTVAGKSKVGRGGVGLKFTPKDVIGEENIWRPVSSEDNSTNWDFEVKTDNFGPLSTIQNGAGTPIEMRLQLLANGIISGEVPAPWGLEGDTTWAGDIDLEFRRILDNKSRKIKYNIFLSQKHYPAPGSVSLILCPNFTEGTSLPFIGIRKLLGNLPLRSIVKYSKVKTTVQKVFALIDPSKTLWNGKIQDDVADKFGLGFAGADFAIKNFKDALASGVLNFNARNLHIGIGLENLYK